MRALWPWLLVLTGCEGWLDGPPPGRPIDGALAFEDVTEASGIVGRGATYGTGWGDADGDGDPDLWSGNHAGEPSLYLNQGDGTFVEDVVDWIDYPRLYDAHGVAWADLDNDGREDLLEAVGAEQGTGTGGNRVHHNLGTGFENVATDAGLIYPLGSGRCPIVYDWNQDGRLDALWNNMPRADGQAPTALFTQGEDGRFALQSLVPVSAEIPTALCGQLADLDGDKVMEVVRFGRPSHLVAHAGHAGGLDDVTASLGLPNANRPHDVVVADFDGDLANDFYITRYEEASDYALDEDGMGIRMALRLFDDAEGVRFRTDGDVTVALDPPWFWSPADIRIGGECRGTTSLSPTLPAGDLAAEGVCPHAGGVDRGLYLSRTDGVWDVELSTDVYDRGSITIRSTAPITDVDLHLWQLTDDEVTSYFRDRLFVSRDGGWKDEGWQRGIQQATSCESIAAGDFDNDMDLDLFLACATPTGNTDNLVYRNDGAGNFTLLQGHGAEGTHEGRADTVVMADYDEDGFLDLFVTNGYAGPPFNDGPHQLFHNLGNDFHWLEIDLHGTRSNRDAIGSTVIVEAGGVTQVREANGGTHNMGQHHRRLHFGLGDNERIDRLEVTWPDGTTTVRTDVPIDTILDLVQE